MNCRFFFVGVYMLREDIEVNKNKKLFRCIIFIIEEIGLYGDRVVDMFLGWVLEF